MKKLFLICTIATIVSCTNTNIKLNLNDDSTRVKEGKRLVTTLGCNDCHSPKKMTEFGPVPNEALLLSGHPHQNPLSDYDSDIPNSGKWILFSGSGTAAVGPWGTSFASNLTPHETGLGNWSLEQFTKAMREGKSKGLENGRTLLPPMPWVGYASLTDEELSAMFDYLQSLEPIDNLVPQPLPPQ